MARIRARVQPRTSKNEIAGQSDGAWRIRLTAPPVDGAANKACAEFLAEALGLKRGQVRLLSGEKSREKTFEAEGISQDEVEERLKAVVSSR